MSNKTRTDIDRVRSLACFAPFVLGNRPWIETFRQVRQHVYGNDPFRTNGGS